MPCPTKLVVRDRRSFARWFYRETSRVSEVVPKAPLPNTSSNNQGSVGDAHFSVIAIDTICLEIAFDVLMQGLEFCKNNGHRLSCIAVSFLREPAGSRCHPVPVTNMYLSPPASEFKCTLTDVRIAGFDDKWTECAAGLLRSTWPRQPLPNFTSEQLRSCSSRFNSLLFVQVSSDVAPEQDVRLYFVQIELLQVRSPSSSVSPVVSVSKFSDAPALVKLRIDPRDLKAPRRSIFRSASPTWQAT